MILDLEQHISISSAEKVDQLCQPLRDMFGIRYFRYLKLYNDGKRIMLSNIPDAVRYIYGQGNHVNLWFDGNHPEFVRAGWHDWYTNMLFDDRDIGEKIENELTAVLNVSHGVTYIKIEKDFYEVFSFDTQSKDIYLVDRSILLHFIYYFKEQAKSLIAASELEPLWFAIEHKNQQQSATEQLLKFLNETKVTRYYLNGEYGDCYLTAKELLCVRWIMAGKTVEEIAVIEGNSARTIRQHIDNIKHKFDCQKQTQIVKLILDAGLSRVLSLIQLTT